MQNAPRGRSQYKPRGRVMYPVEDLRDKLNRLRIHRGDDDDDQSGHRQPPPDPHYNFLRDPLREDFLEGHQPRDFRRGRGRRDLTDQPWRGRGGSRFPEGRPYRGRGSFNSFTTDSLQRMPFDDRQRSFHRGPPRGRAPNRGGGRGNYRSKSADGRRTQSESSNSQKDEELQCLKSPMNIKVDFSLETGVRKCTLDETVILPEIKHNPDEVKVEEKGHSSRGRGGRGANRRGRGRRSFRGRRGQGEKSYGERKTQENVVEGDGEKREEQGTENGEKREEQETENGEKREEQGTGNEEGATSPQDNNTQEPSEVKNDHKPAENNEK